MPTRTVNQGFTDFLSRLTPTAGESTAAQGHRASIKACLERKFGMTHFFQTGSFGNGTSISGHSDVDRFAVIPPQNLNKNSAYTLNQVKNALNISFPNTNVSVSCPAVVIPFGRDAKEKTEVTPAYYIELIRRGNYSVYRIPNCSGGWMRSSPSAHNAYVRNIDQRLGGKVKPLIRFIKAWKYYQNVPISSFYLELRVAKYAEGRLSITYDLDVMNLFSHLHQIGLANIQDPMGISGYINSCSTDVKLMDAKSKLSTALTRSQKAYNARKNGHIQNAFYWWDMLYNGKFPSYYYQTKAV